MFISVIIILLVISFLLALRATRRLNEKPKMGHVKKSLDKHRIIFHGHSSK